MDKQQAMREFEEWVATLIYDEQLSPVMMSAMRHSWQAAQDALMPALVDISELIGLAKNTGSDLYLEKALARLNAIIGDKK